MHAVCVQRIEARLERNRPLKAYYEHAGITIYHGDCRALMSLGLSCDACITDPPYGMDWDTDSRRFSGGSVESVARRGIGRNGQKVAGDQVPFEPNPWISMKRVVFFGFQHFCQKLVPGSVLVWLKRNDHAFGTFLSDADLAWMKGGCGVYCKRDFTLMGETADRLHPTQKPLPLMEWVIRQATEVTDTILDPYMGSGTTLVAAKRLAHKAIGIEIEEKYCEIAAKRLSQEVFQF